MSQEIRKKGIECLSTVLSNEKNCEKIERIIYKLYCENKDNTDDDYINLLYQVSGDILKNKKELKRISDDLKQGKTYFSHRMFEKTKDKIDEHDQYILQPFEVVDGVVECEKCGSSKTWSIQKQTRGADEPMTTFSKCVICKHSWVYSG